MLNDIKVDLPEQPNAQEEDDKIMHGELFEGQWMLVLKTKELTDETMPKNINPNVEILNLQQNKIANLPNTYNLPHLTDLMLWNNHFSIFPRQICCFTKLKILNLAKNRIEMVPPDICKLKNLERLWLHENRLQFLPDEVGELCNLQILVINNNKLKSLPKTLSRLTKLVSLDLSNNLLTDFPEMIYSLLSLRELLLKRNLIRKIHKDIDKLQNLVFLDLHENLIDVLPENICNINTLQSLFLEYNKLHFLPRSIYLMNNLKELELRGNSILEPPESICSQGLGAIKKYQEALDVSSCAVVPRAKVMILGNTQAGKTSLCQTLVSGQSFLAPLSERTEILENSELQIEEGLKLLLLDFGGHDIYNATYKLFFSPDSIYLIVFDSSVYEPRNFPSMIGFWINAIHAAVSGAQIILVGSHIDKCQLDHTHMVALDVWQQIVNLRQKTELNIREIKIKLCNSEYYDDAVKSKLENELYSLKQKLDNFQNIFRAIYFTSSKLNIGIDKIKNLLSKLSASFCVKQRVYPLSWYKFEQLLTSFSTPFFVTMDACTMLAEHAALPADHLPTVLQFLHNISIIIYHQTPKLGNIIFHKPLVLVKLLRNIFCHDWNVMFEKWANKLTLHFTQNQIEDLEKDISTRGMVSKKALEVVLSEYICSTEGAEVILHLLENFGFCFALPQFSQREIVQTLPQAIFSQVYQFPCYMPTEKPAEFEPFWPSLLPMHIHPFQMICQINDNCCKIFSRLRVHMNKSLSWRTDWKTGFIAQCWFLQLFLETEEGPGHHLSINVCGRVQEVPFFIFYMCETMVMIKNLIEKELQEFSGVEFSCHVSCPYCLKLNQKPHNFEVNAIRYQIQNGTKGLYCNKCKKTIEITQLWAVDSFRNDDASFQKMMLQISARLLSHEWKILGRYLGLGETVIDEITTNNPNNLREQVYQMLRRWREMFGHQAGFLELKEALHNINRIDILTDICSAFSNVGNTL